MVLLPFSRSYVLYPCRCLLMQYPHPIADEYFQEIKIAKKDHWNTFLENENPSAIFKALSYTKKKQSDNLPEIKGINNELKSSFPEKCQALKLKLCPTPPASTPFNWDQHKETNWEWPILTQIEVERACCFQANGKAPGHHRIKSIRVKYCKASF